MIGGVEGGSKSIKTIDCGIHAALLLPYTSSVSLLFSCRPTQTPLPKTLKHQSCHLPPVSSTHMASPSKDSDPAK